MTYREALDAHRLARRAGQSRDSSSATGSAALIRAALTMPDAATGGLDEQKPLPKDFITTVARVLYAVRKGQIDQRDGITEILNAAAALDATEPGLDVKSGPWPDCLACRERHVREGHRSEPGSEG